MSAQAPGGIVLFVVAAITLVSAATAFCPTHTIVGISATREDCIARAMASRPRSHTWLRRRAR